MSKLTKGRTPASAKTQVSSFEDDLDFNRLKIDESLKARLQAENLVGRWLNAKRYMAEGNFHASGWKAYRVKPEDSSARGHADFNYGIDPEGFIRRGDLILGVKSTEASARWKARIKARTQSQSQSVRQAAAQIRESLREAGVKASVTEGYDDSAGYRAEPDSDDE